MSKDAPGEESLFARLLCDVMIPAELSEGLRAHGYDVAEARMLSLEVQQDDQALLEHATREGRVVVTCNYSDPQSFTRRGGPKARRRDHPGAPASCQQPFAALGGSRPAAQVVEQLSSRRVTQRTEVAAPRIGDPARP
jgi:hypothetical protein